jgi:SAM-dependent methyltransferase
VTGDYEERLRFFDELALRWDEACDAPRMVERLEEWLGELKPPREGVLLDAGCGTGLLLQALRCYCGPGARLIGLDISPAMLQQAHRKHSTDPRVRLLRGDLLAAPLPTASVDAVLAFSLWPHLSDKERAAGRIHNLLRPGGELHIWHVDSRETINAIHHKAGAAVASDLLEPADELAHRLRRAGFQLTAAREDSRAYRVSARKPR